MKSIILSFLFVAGLGFAHAGPNTVEGIYWTSIAGAPGTQFMLRLDSQGGAEVKSEVTYYERSTKKFQRQTASCAQGSWSAKTDSSKVSIVVNVPNCLEVDQSKALNVKIQIDVVELEYLNDLDSASMMVETSELANGYPTAMNATKFPLDSDRGVYEWENFLK